MFDKLFLDHPRTVDETYFEHLQVAGYFGVTMLAAGLACLVHAIIPGAFTKTGSKAVRHLYERMVSARHRHAPAAETAAS
jgi:hypothetical protein